MNFLRNTKNDCTECDEKFSDHEDLVKHVRKTHHHTIVKCTECGREFIHEKHRLEHFRKEHKEKKARNRTEKNLFKHRGFFKT
ncbi:MAG: C2H2-type zinc finger protein [Nitrosopumilus sp.]|nr:C2H2-type zinc finger protein [Nitrosopumilus sp.]MDH3825175.1 C2H2-type zinc finger protein [Nitrosopumilus sp.]